MDVLQCSHQSSLHCTSEIYLDWTIVSEGVPLGSFRSVASFGRGAYPTNAYELVINYITGPKGKVNPFCLLIKLPSIHQPTNDTDFHMNHTYSRTVRLMTDIKIQCEAWVLVCCPKKFAA